jgi:hypothetical protein
MCFREKWSEVGLMNQEAANPVEKGKHVKPRVERRVPASERFTSLVRVFFVNV